MDENPIFKPRVARSWHLNLTLKTRGAVCVVSWDWYWTAPGGRVSVVKEGINER